MTLLNHWIDNLILMIVYSSVRGVRYKMFEKDASSPNCLEEPSTWQIDVDFNYFGSSFLLTVVLTLFLSIKLWNIYMFALSK